MAPLFKLTEKLNTDLKTVNPFVEKVSREILDRLGCPEEVFKIKLALEEALTNAMRHGNGLETGRKVTARIELDPKNIVLDVHDEGKGFDFQNLPDPTGSDYGSKPSGRGVCLMRKLMDEVEFYDGGSGVKMIKLLNPKP